MSDQTTGQAHRNSINGQTAKLTVLTLAIMNIIAVVSLRGLSAETEYDLSSIFFYLFAALVFLIPVALVSAEMATGWPEKRDIFRWVGKAFGPRLALLAMFMLWIEMTVWFPTALPFGAVSLAFIGPDQKWDEAFVANSVYILAIVVAIYWLATAVAWRGVDMFARVAKWGGILAVVPGKLDIAGFSPPLDGAGNSVRGQVMVASVAPALGVNLFQA